MFRERGGFFFPVRRMRRYSGIMRVRRQDRRRRAAWYLCCPDMLSGSLFEKKGWGMLCLLRRAEDEGTAEFVFSYCAADDVAGAAEDVPYLAVAEAFAKFCDEVGAVAEFGVVIPVHGCPPGG